MLKRHYAFALGSFLLIPVATVLGGMAFSLINPEIAAGHANYERNYRLLEWVQKLSMLATLFLNLGLWISTCLFLLKSKRQSYAWLPLAVLGPFGFIALTLLRDHAPLDGDLHHRLVGRLNVYLRTAYELALFLIVWTLAFGAMVTRREVMIMLEAARTGVAEAQIVEIQNASSGMHAFGEGLEVMYLVVLFYLLWPLCVAVLGRLGKWRAAPGKT